MMKRSIIIFAIILLISLANGEDDVCDYACNYNLDPLCGFDGQEYKYFGNECFMNRHNKCQNKSELKSNILISE